MSASETFLELQSNAPGLPGPYLVENLAPYQILDRMGTRKAKTVLAIGSHYKRQFLKSKCFINNRQRDQSVGLACRPDGTLLLDCELHLQDDDDGGMPRFQEKRPWGGGQNGHVLQRAHRRAAHIAYKLYGEVLALFSDVVLVFVPDLGLAQVLELLCCWLKSATEKKFPRRQRILLLHHNVPHAQDIHSRLVASFMSVLRSSDTVKVYTSENTRQMIADAFHVSNMALWSPLLVSEIDKELASSFSDRIARCLDFEAPLVKHLLQAAIRHHAEQPAVPFDVILASRHQCGPPECLQDTLSDFLGSRPGVGRTDIAVVASALVLDAYPVGTHWFPPGQVFERFYRGATEHCGKLLRCADFAQAVKLEFITLATQNRAAGTAASETHLTRIWKDWAITNTIPFASCSLCIIQEPHWTLDCGHRLCRKCILSHGTLEVAWRPTVTSCPTSKAMTERVHCTFCAIYGVE
ncbi:hypothetical protein ACJ41O_013830 [Fusarium nematophilum]